MSQYQTKMTYLLLISVAALSFACAGTQTNPAAAAASSVALPSPSQPVPSHNDAASIPRVTVEELKKLVADKKVVVIDVRGTDAYQLGHIKGSVNLPLDRIQAGEVKSLPKDKKLVTYCSCPAENSSSVAAEALSKAGFKDLGVLLGGTIAWEKAGGEMEKGTVAKP